METAIYIKASEDRESNQNRLTLLVDRVKSEGSQYKIFSEIFDKKGNQLLKKDLLTRVHKKEFDTILVYKLGEWSVSHVQLSRELNELNLTGIRFISSYENFDSFSITGKLYLKVLLAMNENEKSFDFCVKENSSSNLKPVDHHLPGQKIEDRRTTQGKKAGLDYSRGKISSDETNFSEKSLIPKVNSGSGKDYAKMESFDLVGIDEACSLTGYSKHTLYQFTSRKLIPHFKRPHGRRIFFSKRSLEEWILTGKI